MVRCCGLVSLCRIEYFTRLYVAAGLCWTRTFLSFTVGLITAIPGTMLLFFFLMFVLMFMPFLMLALLDR